MMQTAPREIPDASLPQRRRPKPYYLATDFEDRPDVALTVGYTVRSIALDWGLHPIVHDAERLTTAQVFWLMTHMHPERSRILLVVDYTADARRLEVVVGDTGSYVPVLYEFDIWREGLSPAREVGAIQCSGTARRLHFALRLRAPWRLRITWNREIVGSHHPKVTFEDCASGDDACKHAVTYLKMPGVVSVHRQGPEHGDDEWFDAADGEGEL